MYNHFASLVYSSEWTTIFRNQWILSPEYAKGINTNYFYYFNHFVMIVNQLLFTQSNFFFKSW